MNVSSLAVWYQVYACIFKYARAYREVILLPPTPLRLGIEGCLNECILDGTILNECILDGSMVSSLCVYFQVCACILRGYFAFVGGLPPPHTPPLKIEGCLDEKQ